MTRLLYQNKNEKIKKSFTYKQLIVEAINSFHSKKASSNDIFTFAMTYYGNIFTNLNSMTWKNNIRQLLSKSPEFIKIKQVCECNACKDCLDPKQKFIWVYVSMEKLNKQCLDLKSTT